MRVVDVGKLRVSFNSKSGIYYIKMPISKGETSSSFVQEIRNLVSGSTEAVLDFDRSGKLVGIEVLGAPQSPFKTRVVGRKKKDCFCNKRANCFENRN